MVAALASSLIALLTFLALLSLGYLSFPKRELRGLEGRSSEAAVGGARTCLLAPFSFVVCYPGHMERGSIQLILPRPPSGAGSTLLDDQTPTLNRSGPPLAPPASSSPSSAPPGAQATLLSLNSANICCAPTVSQIRASLPHPPPPLPRHPPLTGRAGLSAS